LPFPECGTGSNNVCVNYKTCVDGKCLLKCDNDNDCIHGVCMPGGYCHHERCTADGTCPDGWVPGTASSTPFSLACMKIR
jgi:hypothetical protein